MKKGWIIGLAVAVVLIVVGVILYSRSVKNRQNEQTYTPAPQDNGKIKVSDVVDAGSAVWGIFKQERQEKKDAEAARKAAESSRLAQNTAVGVRPTPVK